MKKQIALIIISMLAAVSANAQNVNVKNDCKVHNKAPICEAGEGIIQPDLDDIFGNCTCFDFECPEIPVIPEKPEMPENPTLPELPEIPDIPETPIIPEKPDIPETPVVPDVPETEFPDNQQSSLAMQVFTLVNNERINAGLSPLTYDKSLEKAANIRAVEIKSLFSHTRPDGTSCFTVLDEIGYNYRGAGENIAYGQRDAREVMTAWMNSEGHRA